MLGSYELLELLEFMDDEGAFKTAVRGGRWPDWKQMIAETVNEAYRFRASYQLVNGGREAYFDASEFEFLDPVIREIREKNAAADAEAAKTAQARFEAEIGFS